MKSKVYFFIAIGVLLLLFNMYVVPLFQGKVIGVDVQKKATISIPEFTNIDVFEQAIVVSEEVYRKGLISGYNKNTGELLWEYKAPVSTEIHIDKNYILLLKNKNELQAINPNTKQTNWTTTIPFDEDNLPTVIPEIATSAQKVLLMYKQGNSTFLVIMNGESGKIEHRYKFQFDYYRGDKLSNVVDLFKQNIDWSDWHCFEAINMLYNAQTKKVFFLEKQTVWQTKSSLWAVVKEGELRENVLYNLATNQTGFLRFKKTPDVEFFIGTEKYTGLVSIWQGKPIFRVFKSKNLGKAILETMIDKRINPLIEEEHFVYLNTIGQIVIRNLKTEEEQFISLDFLSLMRYNDVLLDNKNLYIRERNNKGNLLHIIPLRFPEKNINND